MPPPPPPPPMVAHITLAHCSHRGCSIVTSSKEHHTQQQSILPSAVSAQIIYNTAAQLIAMHGKGCRSQCGTRAQLVKGLHAVHNVLHALSDGNLVTRFVP